MADPLAGKVIVITGAGGGFGQALTRQLVRAGSRLVLADVDAPVLRDQAARTLKVAGLDDRADQIIGYVAGDLSTTAGCDDVYAQVMALAPQVDILINNAGIGMSGLFSEIPEDRWEQLMQINLLAPMRLTARFLPAMMARRSGQIANVSSVAGIIGTPQLVPYSTAKFGLRGFSEALAHELKPYGIAVTVVYPFFARTPILQSAHYGTQPQGQLPERLVYDPDFVMEQFLRGIRRHQREVFPGALPRALYWLHRFAPWAMPKLG